MEKQIQTAATKTTVRPIMTYVAETRTDTRKIQRLIILLEIAKNKQNAERYYKKWGN